MGLNKRYYCMKNVSDHAKQSDFQSFNLYMTFSDVHLYMDEDCKKVHEEYAKADMPERERIYERIKKFQTSDRAS